MRRKRGIALATLAVGVVAITLVVGYFDNSSVTAQVGTATTGTAAACPAPPQVNRPNPAHANGTIATISGAIFTLTGQNNTTYTVTTDANTHFDKTVASTFGAIAVGDMIMAQGTTSDTTFAATAINDNGKPLQGAGGPGGPPKGNAPSGTQPAGTRPAGTHPALPAGCKPPQGPRGPGGPPPGNNADKGTFTGGIVQQVSGTTLTIKGRDGKTMTVTTSGTTTVSAHQQGSFADLHVGDKVDAMADPKGGTASTATAFTAVRVGDHTAH